MCSTADGGQMLEEALYGRIVRNIVEDKRDHPKKFIAGYKNQQKIAANLKSLNSKTSYLWI
jgi:hypothetical protein